MYQPVNADEISARNSRFNLIVFLLIVILKTALESIKRFISIGNPSEICLFLHRATFVPIWSPTDGTITRITQPSKQTSGRAQIHSAIGEGADEHPERGRNQDALGGGETARHNGVSPL